jgi:hypothetical protein
MRLTFAVALEVAPGIVVAVALMAIAPPAAAAAAAPPPFALLFAARLAAVLVLVRFRAVRLAGQRIVTGLDISFRVGEDLAFGLFRRFRRNWLAVRRRFAAGVAVVAAAAAAAAAPPPA